MKIVLKHFSSALCLSNVLFTVRTIPRRVRMTAARIFHDGKRTDENEPTRSHVIGNETRRNKVIKRRVVRIVFRHKRQI